MACSGLFDETGFEHDVAEVRFTVKLMIPINDTDAPDLGADFHGAG